MVAPGVPHHVTQRGNRRQLTFFCEEDYRFYKALLGQWCGFHGVEIWAYCLMPNHVHMIVVPSSLLSLKLAIGESHRRYTSRINKRQGWTGHLWQGRFFSYPMDDAHLLRAARYIDMNPVRAGLCVLPGQYEWGSAGSRLNGSSDSLITSPCLDQMIKADYELYSAIIDDDELEKIRLHQRTGRPLGRTGFVESLEQSLGVTLKPKRRGRPKKQSAHALKRCES